MLLHAVLFIQLIEITIFFMCPFKVKWTGYISKQLVIFWYLKKLQFIYLVKNNSIVGTIKHFYEIINSLLLPP